MKIHDGSNATVQDVARCARVSVGTVSRVLNGYPNITKKNLERVQEGHRGVGLS